MDNIRAVCLDAYGTLCRIADRRRPYEALHSRLGLDAHEFARLAMTTDAGLAELAERLGRPDAASGLAEDLEAELASVALFDDTAAALDRLRSAGYKLWVASNLAAPYAEPLRRLVGEWADGWSLSFEVGSVKPEAEIFRHACGGLGLPPGEVLMVGDSFAADVAGAGAFGMPAVWLRRGQAGDWPRAAGSLAEAAEKLTSGCHQDRPCRPG